MYAVLYSVYFHCTFRLPSIIVCPANLHQYLVYSVTVVMLGVLKVEIV
jgi:hypothetical protein